MIAKYGVLMIAGLLLLTSCEQQEALAEQSGAAKGAAPARSPVHVDSVISRDEELRLFREDLPRVRSLSGGTKERDSLVAAFVDALERQDTTRLAAMALSKAEFAYLYYPTAREARPPYDLSPSLVWFLTFGRSNQGIRRALYHRGGRPLDVIGYACAPAPDVQGENSIWGRCTVRRLTERGDTVRESLFAQIIERDGHYKFLSYANRLD